MTCNGPLPPTTPTAPFPPPPLIAFDVDAEVGAAFDDESLKSR